MLIKALVAKLLLLPVMWQPPGAPPRETPEQYEHRLTTIARAADAAAQRVPWEWGERAMRLAVLAQFYGETRFGVDVHRGLPGRFGSDRGHSTCLGQIHDQAVSPEVWRGLAGISLPATTRCAVQTALMLRGHQRRCAPGKLSAGRLGLTFQAMGGSRRCKPAGKAALAKVRYFERLR